MPSFKKKKLLQIVSLLQEANEEFGTYTGSNENKIFELLTQCQDLAIKIGINIEQRETFTNKEIVSALEDFCEVLYEFSLEPFNYSLRKKRIKKIRKLLFKVECGIKFNMPDEKPEIVFFPYKASMWDSLESIWIAADKDKNCNAIVVPIPYYEKNPDGSFGKMMYEGNDFPDYVPIVSWQKYDIETECPDIVYIHNPYDEFNLITSVHPNYYSSRLRNFTDLLVYIPYFIYKDILPNNKTNIEGIKHFVKTPGVMYSHLVIVQSQNMQNIYINEYIKYVSEVNGYLDNQIKASIKNKIKGLGSPKYDKVLNSRKKDYDIPDSWKELIGNRKVVLFNTSIKGLLVYEKCYLDKLEKILKLFQDRKDYILWWRPHPLLLTAFDSMRPSLAVRYKNIVNSYINENYGIYDDTTDLNRAIEYSDRYYGDRSSVLELYGITGKPALVSLINQGIREKKEVYSWRTGDIESDDLENWLDGKEQWTIKCSFKELYNGLMLDGKIGQRIHKYVMEE